jgi:hypothetical protein
LAVVHRVKPPHHNKNTRRVFKANEYPANISCRPEVSMRSLPSSLAAPFLLAATLTASAQTSASTPQAQPVPRP